MAGPKGKDARGEHAFGELDWRGGMVCVWTGIHGTATERDLGKIAKCSAHRHFPT